MSTGKLSASSLRADSHPFLVTSVGGKFTREYKNPGEVNISATPKYMGQSCNIYLITNKMLFILFLQGKYTYRGMRMVVLNTHSYKNIRARKKRPPNVNLDDKIKMVLIFINIREKIGEISNLL